MLSFLFLIEPIDNHRENVSGHLGLSAELGEFSRILFDAVLEDEDGSIENCVGDRL
jgi:hypothetical protein